MIRSVHAIVLGRVQGVGYRATTHDEALRRDLAGWVRNRYDGTVEVVAEGEESTLRDFVDYLQRGPRMAHVTRVDVTWGDPTGAPRPFEVRNTA